MKPATRVLPLYSLLLALCLAAGCTVTPSAVAPSQPSFGADGDQDSGIKEFVPGGAVIDASARDRYNALVGLYGEAWSPRIRKDHGIEPRGALFFITNDALQKFIVMSDWRRMGRPPPD